MALKLDHIDPRIKRPPPPKFEFTMTDVPKAAEVTAHIDGRMDEVLQSIGQVLEQDHSAAVRHHLDALTHAITAIELPAPHVDLTPILKAIQSLGVRLQKPTKWTHKIVRGPSGNVREIISTAEGSDSPTANPRLLS